MSRKRESPHIYKIDKNLRINTWDRNSVKQVSTISYICDTPAQEKQLRESLAINLTLNAAGMVEIDCELNIDKFKIENSLFGAENNHIILDDGRIISISCLNISTTLYIPVNSKVRIDAKDNYINLDRHEGELEVYLEGGRLIAENLGTLKGSIKFTKVNVEKVKSASLALQNTEINARSIHELSLESSISRLKIDKVDSLDISASVNDKFQIESIKTIKVDQSVFSDYELGRCDKSIEMTIKNGNISIKNLSPTLQFAYLKNQNGKTQLGVQNLEQYSLLLDSFDQSKYNLPDGLELTNSEGQTRSYKVGRKPLKTKIQIDCKLCDVTISNSSQ